MRRFAELGSVGVVALRHGIFRGGWLPCQDGNFRAADFAQKSVDDAGTGFGVAEGSGYAKDFEFGAFDGEREGEGVVDVVADVGVDDDFLGRGLGVREADA